MDDKELINIAKEAIEKYILDEDVRELKRQFHIILGESLMNDDNNVNNTFYLTYFLQLIEQIVENGFHKERAEREYILTQMMVLELEMTDAFSKQRKIFGVRGEYKGDKKLCYLDQNIFTSYINGENTIQIPDEYLVVYSPAHIEEIYKSPEEFHEKEINNISQKLDDLEILYRDNIAVAVYESPKFVSKRVNDGTKSRELAEQYKILQDQFEESFFGEYRTDKKRQEYNSNNPDTFIANHVELVNEILRKMQRSYTMKDVFAVKGKNDYRVINGYIHDLYMVLDICGVKKDNSERKVRSSRMDIEHLLYAYNTQMFVTKDAKLRYRAKNIFSVLGKETGKDIEYPEP